MYTLKEFMKERKKPIISCDIDGVVLDFGNTMVEWVNENYPQLNAKLTSYDLTLGKELSWKLVKEFWESGAMTHLPFMDGAIAGVNALSKIFVIDVVTAISKTYDAERRENLKGLPFNTITLAPNNKYEYIVDVVKPDVALEDKPELIKKLSEAGIDVYYPIWPYTMDKTLEDYGTPYQNWKQVTKLLQDTYGTD